MDKNILISAPVEFPVIIPKNWNKWWDMWYDEASLLLKVADNHNQKSQAFWRGFDVYVREGFDPLTYFYKSKNMNCPEMFPSLFDNLDRFPVEINVMRVVSSISKVLPHKDTNTPMIGVRTLLYDNNVKPNFYYVFGEKKKYQYLPEDTNTWIYNDHKSLHGSDFYIGHSKLLIMYYGTIKEKILDENLEKNLIRYKDYVIYDN